MKGSRSRLSRFQQDENEYLKVIPYKYGIIWNQFITLVY